VLIKIILTEVHEANPLRDQFIRWPMVVLTLDAIANAAGPIEVWIISPKVTESAKWAKVI
jgi:hypothetical protein